MANKVVATPNTKNPPPTTIFIVGPTASGKSGLSMQVAKKFNGEIICADSQTIKIGLDIGTAKPSKADQQEIKHHLIDVVQPYDKFSVANFKELAEKAINEIKSKNKLPIIVGGSGLYVDALLYNFEFRPTVANIDREELNKKTVAQLRHMIKERGLNLPNNDLNPRHLIRTLESDGAVSQKGSIRQGSLVVGLSPDKNMLEQRIEDRINNMFADGLEDEVRGVVDNYGVAPSNFDAIGYLIVMRMLKGEITEDETKELLLIAHRQYAKRQRSWFRRNKDIAWFENAKDAFEHIKSLF